MNIKFSIKLKLFTILLGLIILFITISWIMNALFIEKFYYFEKKAIIMSTYNKISQIYSDEISKNKGDKNISDKKFSENLSLEIEKLESIQGMNVLIFDENMNLFYSSRRNPFGFRTSGASFFGMLDFMKENEMNISKIEEGKPIVINRYDRRIDSNFISLYAMLNKKLFVYMNLPAKPIKESSDIAIKFSLVTSLLVLLIGAGLIYFISSSFTKPILKLNTIAKKMAQLDFTEKYLDNTRDEIGNLGESINSLSDQLEINLNELKEANIRLRLDIKEKIKVDELRKQFISSASHELKTPIALIQGYAEGLRVNINNDEENKNFYCDVIIDEAQKMNSLVRQLLQLTKLECREMPVEKVNFEIESLINDLLKNMSIMFNNKNVNIETLIKDKIVFADYDKVSRVLVNYLTNAVNHVNIGGIVKIETETISDRLRISVFNTGSEIPEDSLPFIWENFYKVDKARTRSYGGTGLGLSIVKAIQESQNMGYGVKNLKNGVLFWFDVEN